MGRDRREARTHKSRALARAQELLAQELSAQGAPATTRELAPEAGASPRSCLAVGLVPVADGGFELAVRYGGNAPASERVARRVAEEFGPGVDLRDTGAIQVLSGQPLPSAMAVGETSRVRPIRPGVSVAHVNVTAGTLGGFVRVDGEVHALSNHHVLVGDDGELGDPILQPGPLDGGRDPQDRIGLLAALVPLIAGEPATVDAALASLDALEGEPAFHSDHPDGALTGVAGAVGGETVAKTGRTTGYTRGVVTAVELDGVLVDFGPARGVLSFDGQIEVESIGDGPFSQGGDSGSLVYRPDTSQAVGLLFAGSDRGGSNGFGLTYLNPIATVLEALGADLVVEPGQQDAPRGDLRFASESGGEEAASDSGTDRGHPPAEAVPVRTREEARAACTGVRRKVSDLPGVVGIGLRRSGAGYLVVVNVSAPEVVERIPREVRAEVYVRITGTLRPLGAD